MNIINIEIKKAIVLQSSVKFTDAEKIYKALLKGNAHPEVLYLYGHLLSAQGKMEQAESKFKEACSIIPNNIKYVTTLGEFYKYISRYVSAAECFKTLCKLAPNTQQSYVSLANVLKLNRQYEEAIFYLQEGLQCCANKVSLYFNLASLQRTQNQFIDAIESYICR